MNIGHEIEQMVSESFVLHPMLEVERIGSSLYHPLAKDVDFVALVGNVEWWSIDAVERCGWSFCSANPWKYKDGWQALRKGNLNLMVTADKAWFDATVLASRVCQAARLFEKEDRIRVMRVIREGLDPEDARDYRKARGL